MRELSTRAGEMVNGLRNILFPPACLFCCAPVDGSEQCCRACFTALQVWPLHCCGRCGSVMPESLAPGPCGGCLRHPPAQQQSISLYRYSGPVRDAILAWKLQGRDAATRWLVQCAMPHLKTVISPDDLLLPVPMPLSRMRRSGIHHAADLCGWIAGAVDCKWEWRLLRRIGEQPRQSSLSGKARRKNLCKAFSMDHDYLERAGGAGVIWVVDDILTTGATLHYAVKACRVPGKEVRVLSLARSLNRG